MVMERHSIMSVMTLPAVIKKPMLVATIAIAAFACTRVKPCTSASRQISHSTAIAASRCGRRRKNSELRNNSIKSALAQKDSGGLPQKAVP